MPSTVVQVRQVHSTHTVRTKASVLVINTGYLSSRLGILKILILILSLTAFVLMFNEWAFAVSANNRYFVLISFTDWVAVALMLLSCLLSPATATIFPKTTFDFLFHIVFGILILVAGILTSTTAFDRYESKQAKAACILAIVCGIVQLVHGYFSYRFNIDN